MRFFGTGTAAFLWRLVLCVPLLAVSRAFVCVAVIGVSQLPGAEQAALSATYARAATTASICLVLAVPAAAYRPSLLWVVPLAVTGAAGAAGWSVMPMPLPLNEWMASVEGAVLLLPIMVLVLGAWWRLVPEGLAEAASASGASPLRAFSLGVLAPALPGVARGLALVFVLALGLAPLLAHSSGSP